MRLRRAGEPAGRLPLGRYRGGVQDGRAGKASGSVRAELCRDFPDQYKDPDDIWYGEILLPEVIMYNSDTLAPEDVPVSWNDLLDAKFEDEIIIRDGLFEQVLDVIHSADVCQLQQFADLLPPRFFFWCAIPSCHDLCTFSVLFLFYTALSVNMLALFQIWQRFSTRPMAF